MPIYQRNNYGVTTLGSREIAARERRYPTNPDCIACHDTRRCMWCGGSGIEPDPITPDDFYDDDLIPHCDIDQSPRPVCWLCHGNRLCTGCSHAYPPQNPLYIYLYPTNPGGKKKRIKTPDYI